MLIDYIDGPNRLIYLSIDTVNTEVHPIDIYKEMRTIRRLNESLRQYDIFLKAYGNEDKGGGKATERYVQAIQGTKIVPYDTSHIITIIGTLISDDGQEGVALFDRSSLSPGVEVDINYVPPQVEVITISTTGGSGASAQELWEYATRSLTEEVNANVVKVNQIVVTSPDDFKADSVSVDLSGIPADVWEYATRTLTTTVFDTNIVKVNGVLVNSIDEFKADVSNLSADVNIVEVNGVQVNSIEDFKAAEFDGNANIVSVNNIVVTSPDDFKADIPIVDGASIASDVWTYNGTRELTVPSGLTPAQESTLNQISLDTDNIPGDVWSFATRELSNIAADIKFVNGIAVSSIDEFKATDVDLTPVTDQLTTIEGKIDTKPTLLDIENSTILAKEASIGVVETLVNSLPVLADIKEEMVNVQFGKLEITDNQMTIWDKQGNILTVFDLFDKNGLPTMSNVYTRTIVSP